MSEEINIDKIYRESLSIFLKDLAKEKKYEPVSDWEKSFATRGFQRGWREGARCCSKIISVP